MDKYIYFTATDTTRRVFDALGADCHKCVNISKSKPSDEVLCFCKDDVVYVGFPVFGGRVPAIVLERIDALKGNGCKAIVVAVYGNRHYDDSIKEMQAFLECHGCSVVAAIAAVAQHSMVPSIATGRPNAGDMARLREIKAEIDAKLASGTLIAMPKRPDETYKEYRPLPILPISTDECSSCGLCADECPVDAISLGPTCETDATRCIICMRCVAVCPSKARQLPPEMQQAVKARLESRCPVNREIELFFADALSN